MSKELIESLRGIARNGTWYDEVDEDLRHPVCVRAADLLERQSDMLEKAREALIHADLKIRSLPGQDQSDVEFIRAALKSLEE